MYYSHVLSTKQTAGAAERASEVGRNVLGGTGVTEALAVVKERIPNLADDIRGTVKIVELHPCR